jgi:hypothetical protein
MAKSYVIRYETCSFVGKTNTNKVKSVHISISNAHIRRSCVVVQGKELLQEEASYKNVEKLRLSDCTSTVMVPII